MKTLKIDLDELKRDFKLVNCGELIKEMEIGKKCLGSIHFYIKLIKFENT